jgi:UDP-galactopyranose mutase
VPIASPANSKEAILAAVGVELYEFFYKGYTRSSGGGPPRPSTPPSAAGSRSTPGLDERYFRDEFQALPKEGYHPMFEAILEASKADLRLETDYREVLPHVRHRHLIYSGPSTSIFECRFGPLPYRTARYALEEIGQDQVPKGGFVQPVLQVNYPGPEPFTRTVELKHVTGQVSRCSNLVREFPAEYRPGESDPNYPVPGRGERLRSPRATGSWRTRAGRDLHRPPRAVPLPQHGPGRRSGPPHLREAAGPAARAAAGVSGRRAGALPEPHPAPVLGGR